MDKRTHVLIRASALLIGFPTDETLCIERKQGRNGQTVETLHIENCHKHTCGDCEPYRKPRGFGEKNRRFKLDDARVHRAWELAGGLCRCVDQKDKTYRNLRPVKETIEKTLEPKDIGYPVWRYPGLGARYIAGRKALLGQNLRSIRGTPDQALYICGRRINEHELFDTVKKFASWRGEILNRRRKHSVEETIHAETKHLASVELSGINNILARYPNPNLPHAGRKENHAWVKHVLRRNNQAEVNSDIGKYLDLYCDPAKTWMILVFYKDLGRNKRNRTYELGFKDPCWMETYLQTEVDATQPGANYKDAVWISISKTIGLCIEDHVEAHRGNRTKRAHKHTIGSTNSNLRELLTVDVAPDKTGVQLWLEDSKKPVKLETRKDRLDHYMKIARKL